MKKINDLLFIFSIGFLIGLQYLTRTFLFSNNASTNAVVVDLIFNLLLATCLLGFYIKKYSPDRFRIILVGIFLIELIIGIFLRKLNLPYGFTIMLFGLLGVLATWRYTHKNRLRFLQKND